jgi:hypothetical protein
MKWTKHDTVFGVALTFVIFAFVWGCNVSCTTQKQIQTLRVDSTSEKIDSVKLLQEEVNRLTNENIQLQYLGISFDTVRGDTIRNVITIHEGNIEASGKIVSAKVATSFLQRVVVEQKRTIDSLSLVKSKVNVVTEYKDRMVKRTIFPWWFILIAAGLFIVIKKLKV